MGLSMDAIDSIDLPTTRRKLTRPLSGTVSLLMRLTIAGLVLPPLVGSLEDGHPYLWGFGPRVICATVSLNGLMQGGGQPLAFMRPGMTSSAANVNVCAAHPTLSQRFLVTLTQAPSTLLALGVLVMLTLIIQAVRRNGPFDLSVTRRLRFLAWFGLLAALGVNALQGYGAAAFSATAQRQPPGSLDPITVPVGLDTFNALFDNLLPLLLVMCGLLTLARIIRIGAQMHDDLAGTV